MSARRELAVIFGGLVLVIAVAVGAVLKKEAVMKDGELVLLQLAPVDPRSLIQGDYMQLNYAMSRQLDSEPDWPDDGYVVVRLDEHDVATFVRLHNRQPLSENETRVRYRRRSNSIQVGPNAFYFQEGHASHYETARYGAVRVSDSGDVVLVGLRNEDFTPSGPPVQ